MRNSRTDRWTIVALALTLCLAARPAPAQETSAAEADLLYRARDWPRAVTAYEALTRKDPDQPASWFRLAVSLRELGRFEEAVAAYESAMRAGYPAFSVWPEQARALARLGDTDRAFERLGRLLETGNPALPLLADEPDFMGLRGDPRWSDTLARAEKNTRPCAHEPARRALDFWIGEWDVETAEGRPAGRSRVEKVLESCVVLENWWGRNGYEGKSFNIFHRDRGLWEQLWVDSVGRLTRFEGEARDGNLYYRTQAAAPDGRPRLRRMTFFNEGPDRVRQVGEGSMDDGGTWTVDYDLLYKRRQ